MKFSYNWLQTYFEKPLPAPEKLVDIFTFRFAEVESLETQGADSIFDLKILPDRACYALSHRGVAREIAASTGVLLASEKAITEVLVKGNLLKISIEDLNLCPHYIGALIEDVASVDTPTWIKARLASVGQRSINCVVDIANYLMLDVGQPLHAFDADKVQGLLSVRLARKGETMTTLDNRDIIFDGSELLIADEKGPLGIAGIKGGKRAEVTKESRRLILEAALFDGVTLRRTSTKIGIRTDASKRFENKIPFSLQEETMKRFISMVIEVCKARAADYCDVGSLTVMPREIEVSATVINDVLGSSIATLEIERVLTSLSISFTKKGEEYTLAIPSWRLDLVIFEDIAEEIGRLYGYENIAPKLPPKITNVLRPLKTLYWQEKIKSFLVGEGFSEVVTYSFRKNGSMEVIKSMASDKNFLRADLSKNMTEALAVNQNNAPLLGLDVMRIFEIGKVFPKTGEHTALSIGISAPKSMKKFKANEEIKAVREKLMTFLGTEVQTLCTVDDSGGILNIKGKPAGQINSIEGILEINLDMLVVELKDPESWLIMEKVSNKFKTFSLYPFIARDIAVFVPATVTKDDLEKVILSKTGELLVKHYLFDEFKKGDKTSFGFRLIFQSPERTLTDDEVNRIMDGIYIEVKGQGWEVR